MLLLLMVPWLRRSSSRPAVMPLVVIFRVAEIAPVG
jgi:hypothetical protein